MLEDDKKLTRTMDPQFALGMIASEGCFSANMSLYESNRFGVQAVLTFHLGMSNRDRDIIEELQDELGVGDIKDHQGVRLQVQRHDELDELIEYIEEHRGGAFEKTAKFEAYRKWRDLWADRDELVKTKKGMKEFVERARRINPDDARRGRSVEELHEIIEENADPHEEREVLKQHRDDGMTYAEIAEKYDIETYTVKYWLQKHGLTS